jgi:hypothetical protein
MNDSRIEQVAIGTNIAQAAGDNAVATVNVFQGEHHNEWHSTIRPLPTNIPTNEQHTRLQDEFYEGGYTRFEHILVGLDFPRDEKLTAIAQAFTKRNIVIVHAASGQGKTTLAYRYLYNNYTNDKRFVIERIQDLRHATTIAGALIDFVATQREPIVVYMDVHPQDTAWTDVARQLAHQPNLHLLITIREEDFQRANVAGAGFLAEEVDLTFTQAEARLIFARSDTAVRHARFLTFEDAWATFNSNGPLLEFVYLLTHTTTLRQRLAGQVFALRQEARQEKNKDKLRVLELVAVASACDARLQTNKLISALYLFDAEDTLQLLEQEYLIRRNKEEQTIGGLHAVRSQILVELLTSPDVTPWLTLAKQVLPLLCEEDLETFLLHAFVEHPTDLGLLLSLITTFQPATWRGGAGLLRCLLWAGVRAYLSTNQVVIEEAYRLMGRAWFMIVHLNFAGDDVTDSQSIWSSLAGIIDKEKLDQFIALQARQTPTAEALQAATQWLSNLQPLVQAPINAADWAGVAELFYWAGRCGQPHIVHWLSESALLSAVDALPLSMCADLSLALFTLDRATHTRWLAQVRPTLERRLAQEEGIVWLEQREETLKLHFITSYGYEAQLERLAKRRPNDPLHELTLRRIQLVRNLLPGYERYGALGYGHKIQGITLPAGSTEKEGVLRKYLPPSWGVRLNGIAGSIVRNQSRLATWPAYIDQLLTLRTTILTSLRELRRGLERYLESKHSVDIYGPYVNKTTWQSSFSQTNAPPELPQVAVDPWGLSTEGQASSAAAHLESQEYVRLTPRAIALARYQEFLEAQKEYLFALHAFFMQAVHVMVVNVATKKRIIMHEPAIVAAALQQYGVRTDFDHRSTHHLWQAKQALALFQHHFRQQFAQLVDGPRLTTLEEEETRLLSHLWQLWYHYAYKPEQVIRKPFQTAPKIVATAEAALDSQIQQALAQVSKERINATRIDTTLCWEDASALWISLDVENPVMLYLAYETLVSALQGELNSVQSRDLEHFLLREFYEYTVIIPLVRGRLLNAYVFRLYTLSTLLSTQPMTEHLVSFMPTPLPDAYANALGLTYWQAAEITAANRLSASLAGLMQLAGQIAEFAPLPDRTEPGEAVLKAYLDEQAKPLSECVQSYMDTTVELLARFQALTETDRMQREYLVEAIKRSVEIHKIVWPWSEGEGIVLALDEMVSYAQQLQGIFLEAELVRLLWIADVLTQMDHLDVNR